MRMHEAVFSVLAVVLFLTGCLRSEAGPSACDGLSEKTLGITRDDYSDCAGEILAEIDGLGLHLERLVRQDDKESLPEARKHNARLRHLMDEVGFQADVYRDMGSRELALRWPDSSMRSFNVSAMSAATQFAATLVYPNDDNLRQGENHYEKARQAYSQFRK